MRKNFLLIAFLITLSVIVAVSFAALTIAVKDVSGGTPASSLETAAVSTAGTITQTSWSIQWSTPITLTTTQKTLSAYDSKSQVDVTSGVTLELISGGVKYGSIYYDSDFYICKDGTKDSGSGNLIVQGATSTTTKECVIIIKLDGSAIQNKITSYQNELPGGTLEYVNLNLYIAATSPVSGAEPPLVAYPITTDFDASTLAWGDVSNLYASSPSAPMWVRGGLWTGAYRFHMFDIKSFPFSSLKGILIKYSPITIPGTIFQIQYERLSSVKTSRPGDASTVKPMYTKDPVYYTSGYVYSPLINAGESVTWDSIEWSSTEPSGTAVNIGACTGDSSTMGISVTASGGVGCTGTGGTLKGPSSASPVTIGTTGQYMKYIIKLTGTTSSVPTVSSVKIKYTKAPQQITLGTAAATQYATQIEHKAISSVIGKCWVYLTTPDTTPCGSAENKCWPTYGEASEEFAIAKGYSQKRYSEPQYCKITSASCACSVGYQEKTTTTTCSSEFSKCTWKPGYDATCPFYSSVKTKKIVNCDATGWVKEKCEPSSGCVGQSIGTDKTCECEPVFTSGEKVAKAETKTGTCTSLGGKCCDSAATCSGTIVKASGCDTCCTGTSAKCFGVELGGVYNRDSGARSWCGWWCDPATGLKITTIRNIGSDKLTSLKIKVTVKTYSDCAGDKTEDSYTVGDLDYGNIHYGFDLDDFCDGAKKFEVKAVDGSGVVVDKYCLDCQISGGGMCLISKGTCS